MDYQVTLGDYIEFVDKAKDILTDAGFKYYTHFIERTPHFIKL